MPIDALFPSFDWLPRPITHARGQKGDDMEERKLPEDDSPEATNEASLSEEVIDPSAPVEFEEDDDDGR
jgi:hypothetical protein